MTLQNEIEKIFSLYKTATDVRELAETSPPELLWDMAVYEVVTLIQDREKKAEEVWLNKLCAWYITEGFKENQVEAFKSRYSRYLQTLKEER